MNKALAALFTSILFCAPTPARATTIDPLPWELMFLQADMVAEVQCVTAGGIVARYKVLRSWRGPAAGSQVKIRVAVNYWEPQFPVALCGQRYLVAAYRSPPGTMVSTTTGGGVPLWWRDIRADYRLPLFQGRVALPSDAKKTVDLGKLGKVTVGALDGKLKALLAGTPAQLEARLLKLHAHRAFFRARQRYARDWKDHARHRARLQKAKTAQQVLAVLAAVARAHPRDARYGLRHALTGGGGKITLVALQNKPWTSVPNLDRAAVAASIRQRQNGRASAHRPAPRAVPAPNAGELKRLRAALAGGRKNRAFSRALVVLSAHDPATVAGYLSAWVPTGKHWGAGTMGYSLGSYFAWRCGKDREKHLTTLIKAKDPHVRVAGAVYLVFEDRKAGMAALARMAKLPGVPGAWAAINLARRGARAGVDRALKLLLTKSSGGMAGLPQRNLLKRLLVLLSNAACEARVSQPAVSAYMPESTHAGLLAWWKRHRKKLKLADPWLRVLEQQKVD